MGKQGKHRIRRMGVAVLAIALVLVMTCGTAMAAYSTLRRGSSGEKVRTMQKSLIALGYYSGVADGKYGASTEAAVRAFQLSAGLDVDGKAGDKTLTALYGATSNTTSSPTGSATTSAALFKGDYSVMKYGSHGDRVKTLQKALATLGYSTGNIDGVYGASTGRAVTAFQTKYGLTADGKAGKNTLTALEKVVAGGSIAVPPVPDKTVGSFKPSRNIKKYCQGSDVMNVQIRLQVYGYYNGKLDGKFGSGMDAAVRNFQAAYGLKVDGVCGNEVYAILFAESIIAPNSTPTVPSASTSNSIPTRTLRKGCYGEDVKHVQQKLKDAGFYSGSIDGKYGAATVASVTAFQQAHGLTADGVAGKATYAVLFASGSSSSSQTAPETPSSTPTDITLSVGSSGANVTALQNRLRELDYTVNVTGTFDTVTKDAVISFQIKNNLKTDGVAGPNTLTLLFSNNCIKANENPATTSSPVVTSVPSPSQIKLLHWYNDVKPNLKDGAVLQVVDPANGYTWNLKVLSRGHHADSEPLTKRDTDTMYAAFGNKFGWICKPVYVKLPNGTWTVAATHDMPHLSGSISDNGFDGHLCVHFLRDMEETEKNDPNWGVTNQKAIRTLWKSISGQDLDY